MASLLLPDDVTQPLQPLLPVGDDRPPALQPDDRAEAMGRLYKLISERMESNAKSGIWNPSNPVGTEHLKPQVQQSVGMPDPSFRPGVLAGGGTTPMSAEQIDAFREGSRNFYDQASLLAGLPGGGPASARVAASRRPLANPPPPSRGAVAETPPDPPGLLAYHGSPHSFDKFDSAKIGTGEGAQAYGHGLYFAENEGVAQGYRKKLSGQNPSWSGEQTDPAFVKALKDQDYLGFDSAGQAIRAMENHPDWAERWDVEKPDNLAAHFDTHQRSKYGGQGSMYEVNLKADPEHFLDWDKPLGEQHPKVREAMRQVLSPDNYKQFLEGQGQKMTAGEMHDFAYRMNPKQFAIGAREAGIPGIRYFDQGSRGAGEGSHNYVAFDDKKIEILRKYGLLGLLGGGAAAGLGGTANAAPAGVLGPSAE